MFEQWYSVSVGNAVPVSQGSLLNENSSARCQVLLKANLSTDTNNPNQTKLNDAYV